ncbi:N-formylglutamate deformylase [Silanimonas sp.]|uniref:N-formylglutamate deformylase n=1 Tax=Silanimonas sp. TaxID=1929290 RepID=UPI0022C70DFE|nr:N-formylglutamate deformylase [Silanimonas sp.]MCZ8063531.1 N-formylglutamate deformylase [Silanimonas sp.]
MDLFSLRRGRAPLLISVPHDGAHIPPDLAARMSPEARTAPDTDWWMSKLYGPIAEALDASLIVPTHSRYVVDLNRPPDDVSLYPGQNTTGLCPAVRFSGDPVYLDGQGPDADEIAARVETYWRPYHEALAAELARLRALHGRVLLWEGHSIASTVPFLFEGELPELNVGTAAGASCRFATEAGLRASLEAQSRFSWVLNGRFKGGYITRHYGRPDDGIEAVQLETAQRAYMVEPDGSFVPERAAPLQGQVRALIEAALRA